MASKDDQIRALLEGRAYKLVMQELGITELTANSYAQVFTVTRKDIDAYVARNGIPSNRYHTQDSLNEGVHLIFENEVWRVYDRDRGIKFDEQKFANEESARQEVVTRLLRFSGTGLTFA